MFNNHTTANLIAKRIYQIDIQCRREFHRGDIQDENDYTSQFTREVRKQLKPICSINAYSRKLSGSEERTFGCDGLMMFSDNSYCKIGLFEAKHPFRTGFDQNNRFTGQMSRQHNFCHQAAIWEMFYNSNSPHDNFPPFDPYGSNCVWHDDAYRFALRRPNRPWQLNTVTRLLSANSNNIHDIVYNIMMCYKGQKISINKKRNTVDLKGENESISIPFPQQEGFISDTKDQRISAFMEDNGIASYIFLKDSVNNE